jgi:(E)-4-hydroxy-3-methylbut-2-enyl-diphosphate synthase
VLAEDTSDIASFTGAVAVAVGAAIFSAGVAIGVSVSANDVGNTVRARIDDSKVASAAALSILLSEGIGDTLRVSLTGDPAEEVKVGIELLKAMGLRKTGVEFVSCPTCGRTRIDLIKVANEVEQRLSGCKKHIRVAVMGCAVNGPGEAREADIGIAGGDGVALIFRKGEIIKKVPQDRIVEELMTEIEKL